jgi:NitT/TauT family transport system substrate-binding protein
MVRFVRASMKGWHYAVEHPDEAAEITVDAGAQDENHQKYMAGEVAKLIGDGKLDEAAYDRTAKMVVDQKIVSKAPEGAWTHEITDKAIK